MHEHTVVVVAAGGHPAPRAVPPLPADATVVAADGGIDTALALGLHIDVAIGDFDSVSASGLAAAEAAGTRVERHPTAKDATDLELALDTAIALSPARIVAVGSDGGRLDHLVASLLLLADERYAAARISAFLGSARIDVVRGTATIPGEPGALVSLLPLHGPADGVRTEGLAYPLHDETLDTGSSRGVSNVFIGHTARVQVARGCLVAIQPGSREAIR